MSLGITGLFSNDDQQEQDFQLCGLCVSEKTYGFCALTGRYISEVHDSGPSVPIVYGDVQSLLSIWRIWSAGFPATARRLYETNRYSDV